MSQRLNSSLVMFESPTLATLLAGTSPPQPAATAAQAVASATDASEREGVNRGKVISRCLGLKSQARLKIGRRRNSSGGGARQRRMVASHLSRVRTFVPAAERDSRPLFQAPRAAGMLERISSQRRQCRAQARAERRRATTNARIAEKTKAHANSATK
ncbi:MAG: hypothetical protein H0T19_06180 [Thermoleophilaceae bacterium]|nr:hypothetical protein [Thermoleophilaceae bacterium]